MSVSRHFLLQALQCPCLCENGSAETTVAEGSRNVKLKSYNIFTATNFIRGRTDKNAEVSPNSVLTV